MNENEYLDENKQLILAILENQNSGKADECAENQAKLQRNLMYLAAIADSQPQVPTIAQNRTTVISYYTSIVQMDVFANRANAVAAMQSSARYMQQHQAAQQMTPQSLMAARSSMLYSQSPMSALQQQQQQAAMHSQLAMSSGGNNSSTGGFTILHGEASIGGNGSMTSGGVFGDFGRSSGGKQETGSEGHGTETPMYLKGSEEEGN
ncbi:uncharacterized protein A4U43_C01F21540 [Asparagus officinalis]|uniref:SS18 N-terminal domain-containing protein n=2 Tax=Asparagus officinalis TaxID=4686 RepID=A0A5P1FVI0_ASPOF|nr:uncharacterized protein A4U43_C01F21540 [Asparagus officinalis]